MNQTRIQPTETLFRQLAYVGALTTLPILAASQNAAPNAVANMEKSSPAQSRTTQSANTTVVLNKRKFDLARDEDWQAFVQTLQDLRDLSKEEKKDKKKEKKEKKEEKKEKKEEKKEKKEEKKEEKANQKTGGQAAEKTTGSNSNTGTKLRAHVQVAQDKTRAASDTPPQADILTEDNEASTEKQSHLLDEARRSGRDWSGKKVRAGLKALESITQQMRDGIQEKTAGIHALQEISWAVESNFVTPYTWRPNLDLGDVFFRTRYLMLNPIGRGNAKDPAVNLRDYSAPDLSKVDPLPSTFWTPPGAIAAKDLYAGFDRAAMPAFADTICDYDSPHKGYGIHPSFEVVQNNRHWKVKFGNERSSEPFACRIFWALGFPANIVDYTPQVKVHYDRRILSDFNSRKLNTTHVKFAGIPIMTTHINRYSDPFAYIRYAVLKDGSHVAANDLREQLFPVASGHSRSQHPELKAAQYDTAFERKIDYLVMEAAGFSSKDGDLDSDTQDSAQNTKSPSSDTAGGKAEETMQEIGNWDFNYLEHPRRREVRGLGVLNAWLENYDVRWGNNALDLVESADGVRLRHVVSDLGGIFGQSSGMVRARRGGFATGLYGNAPNEYGWTCTHPQAAGKTTVPIQDYMPVTKTEPFSEMNLDDARWMARLIAQLTEAQLKTALIGAGYDAPTARILLEKLVSRRDRMIQDFGLSGEIAPLRPAGVNKHLSYDAKTDGPFTITLPDGHTITAPDSTETLLVNGILKPMPQQHFE